MRITGGNFRGRLLEQPRDNRIRPTSDKVRQAIFNMIEARGRLHGAIVMDAFCGTGALGLEALSRGATACIFSDNDPTSLALAKRNAKSLEITHTEFLKMDAGRAPQPNHLFGKVSLLFLDPPYKKGLIAASLTALTEQGWLAENCLIVAESEKNYALDDVQISYDLLQQKNYGDTSVHIMELKS
ncbi:MAG: 16S rRNA (guanine(966)-N(2))-methyltransferase RsmD [Pseudobdellovibrionaceae bacterium]